MSADDDPTRPSMRSVRCYVCRRHVPVEAWPNHIQEHKRRMMLGLEADPHDPAPRTSMRTLFELRGRSWVVSGLLFIAAGIITYLLVH